MLTYIPAQYLFPLAFPFVDSPTQLIWIWILFVFHGKIETTQCVK